MPDSDARLTEAIVLAAAGDTIAARGEDYVRYVRALRVVGATAHATIQAKNVYQVALDWSDGRLRGDCTCPHAASGAFCKHQAAVGFSVVDGAAGSTEQPGTVEDPIEVFDLEALRALVTELMTRDPGVARLVETRAAAYRGDTEGLSETLVDAVNDTLGGRGFIDYRRSFEVARDAEDLLDELEGLLDARSPDAVATALLRATKRLQKLAMHADDSGGVIGSACQRALELYARACREGSPDGPKLARWLAKFRADSPGWPQATLEDFVEAFDDKALKAYRRAVANLDGKHQDDDRWARFEIDRMQLELADHDGDVDLAVQILSRDERPSYGAIVQRLRAAGRAEDAVSWIDRAVAEGRVSRHPGGNDYWLDPQDVAETYLAIGREDDAVEVLRQAFLKDPGAATYRALTALAGGLGRADAERDWAVSQARQLAVRTFPAGAPLVDIALSEGDLDAAWQAAHEFGPGHLWKNLADASAQDRPREAADLYWPGLEADLQVADTKRYAGIAGRLATMRDLYGAAGDQDEFAALMSEIRETYGRRPSLMAALDRRHLP